MKKTAIFCELQDSHLIEEDLIQMKCINGFENEKYRQIILMHLQIGKLSIEKCVEFVQQQEQNLIQQNLRIYSRKWTYTQEKEDRIICKIFAVIIIIKKSNNGRHIKIEAKMFQNESF